MAIYPNGLHLLRSPARFTGGSPANGRSHAARAVVAANMGGKRHNCFISETWSRLAARPYGYGGETPWLAITAGGMAHASARDVAISATATGTMGFPIAGSASFSIGFADAVILPEDDASPLRSASASFSFAADATGSLISTASGVAGFSISGTATATGTISGAGSAVMSISCAPALLGGLADLEGSAVFSVGFADADILPEDDTSPLREASASFAFSADGWMLPLDDTPPERSASASFSVSGLVLPAPAYAIGWMEGSTAGGDGDVLTAGQIADATLAALNGATIPVNVARINDVALTGAGVTGNAWRPA